MKLKRPTTTEPKEIKMVALNHRRGNGLEGESTCSGNCTQCSQEKLSESGIKEQAK
jgi:hypothetical protein